ncbi:hypothetical protein ACU4GD_23495 [Cupriavidus basilensis]
MPLLFAGLLRRLGQCVTARPRSAPKRRFTFEHVAWISAPRRHPGSPCLPCILSIRCPCTRLAVALELEGRLTPRHAGAGIPL